MFEVEVLRTELIRLPKSSSEAKLKAENCTDLSNREIEIDGKSISPYALRRDSQPGLKNILLKGQMMYLNDIIGIIFLCCPV